MASAGCVEAAVRCPQTLTSRFARPLAAVLLLQLLLRSCGGRVSRRPSLRRCKTLQYLLSPVATAR